MTVNHNHWPDLPYQEFKSTAHLVHMAIQMIGKLKLYTPFEPHWANVCLFLTSRGLTSGLIPNNSSAFSVDLDFMDHLLTISTTDGLQEKMLLKSMSVADLYQKFFVVLRGFNIHLMINPKPQELPSPIPFDEDKEIREYRKDLALAWWQIMVKSYLVMKKHHARFDGETPPVGLMWGTFDLRDARYNGVKVTPTGINQGYIRRNAMDEGQVEVGFWPGNEFYPKPAYFSFVYPEPENIKEQTIQPEAARWDANLLEFIVDYDDIRKSERPEEDLLKFFQSTYQVGAKCGGWKNFIVPGEPV